MTLVVFCAFCNKKAHFKIGVSICFSKGITFPTALTRGGLGVLLALKVDSFNTLDAVLVSLAGLRSGEMTLLAVTLVDWRTVRMLVTFAHCKKSSSYSSWITSQTWSKRIQGRSNSVGSRWHHTGAKFRLKRSSLSWVTQCDWDVQVLDRTGSGSPKLNLRWPCWIRFRELQDPFEVNKASRELTWFRIAHQLMWSLELLNLEKFVRTWSQAAKKIWGFFGGRGFCIGGSTLTWHCTVCQKLPQHQKVADRLLVSCLYYLLTRSNSGAFAGLQSFSLSSHFGRSGSEAPVEQRWWDPAGKR